MKVRNIIHKAAVLGSGATMMGATIAGALAYDLADYPAEYIVDGNFDGKIVVGEKAATGDVLGSVDIAASLQARSITSEAVEIPGQAGEVTLSGDAFRVETSSDLLEIRETVGDVYDTLTDTELDALRGGSITTDEGNTDYNQYLRFANTGHATLQEFAVNIAEDSDNDILSDFLIIEDDSPFFEWEIEFTEGLESAMTSELTDLEDEVFNIFGTDFTFVDSDITSSGNYPLTLSFMAGDVSDTLREGETKTYTIDGVDYEVTAVFISDPSNNDPEAKFAVNGEITDSLLDGGTDTLNSGLQIGVRDLLVNSREGVVEFFLGANKIEFTDADTTSDNWGGTVEMGNENINEAEVSIYGKQIGSSAKYEIFSIKYRLTAESTDGGELYIAPQQGVRDHLDEPVGLLSPSFDIRYEGLKDVKTTDIELDPSGGDKEYRISVTNVRGNEYSWPLITNEDDTFEWGDKDDEFWFVEPSVDTTDGSISANITAGDMYIADEDYFVVGERNVTSTSELSKDDSAVYQYKKIDTDNTLLTLRDVSTGEDKELTYTEYSGTNTALNGTADVVIAGTTYEIWIGQDPFNLAVDLNDNEKLEGDRIGFTVMGGATIDFDTDGTEQVAGTAGVTSGVNVNMSLIEEAENFDTSTNTDGVLTWRVLERDNEEIGLGSVDFTGPIEAGSSDAWDQFSFESDPDNDEREYSYTDFGAYVELHNPSGSDEAEKLTVNFPENQVGAQVFVTAGTTEATSGSAGSVQRDVVNPISVGMAVLDSDADGYLGSENLIIVGGPCANSVASAFLGNPAECGEGFEPGKAMISAQEFGDSVAILVAGYEAQETLGASYVLADYAMYLADVEGSEVEVVATDLSDLQVSAPEMADDEE